MCDADGVVLVAMRQLTICCGDLAAVGAEDPVCTVIQDEDDGVILGEHVRV